MATRMSVGADHARRRGLTGKGGSEVRDEGLRGLGWRVGLGIGTPVGPVVWRTTVFIGTQVTGMGQIEANRIPSCVGDAAAQASSLPYSVCSSRVGRHGAGQCRRACCQLAPLYRGSGNRSPTEVAPTVRRVDPLAAAGSSTEPSIRAKLCTATAIWRAVAQDLR